jgi:hypothetical protein
VLLMVITKKHVFPYSALTVGFYNHDGVCLLRGTNQTLNPVLVTVFFSKQMLKWFHVPTACFSCRPFNLNSSKLPPCLKVKLINFPNYAVYHQPETKFPRLLFQATMSPLYCHHFHFHFHAIPKEG